VERSDPGRRARESEEQTDEVLTEQIEYYGARAHEYDEWWERSGRYDRGPEARATWFREKDQVLVAFDELDLRGDVLELASGTGIWTERLVRTARSLTAIDASAEMIAANRERWGREQRA
jgi:SAM-dependent methyltransferase